MDNRSEAQRWVKLAAMDFDSAEYLTGMYPVPIEIICYHCQQSAEKHLKGFLVLHGVNPPKTHDLDELNKLCLKFSAVFSDIADHCSDLTVYGVQPRYPMGLELDENDMKRALLGAKVIHDLILSHESD